MFAKLVVRGTRCQGWLGVFLSLSCLSAGYKRGDSSPACRVLANGEAKVGRAVSDLGWGRGDHSIEAVKCGGERGTCLTDCWGTSAFPSLELGV